MAKPVTLPLWATDTTNTTVGAVENGLTVKLEPALGIKQQGWIAGETAPARWLNFWMNLVYTWILYLDGLVTDAQFLASAFNWTGAHDFNGTARFDAAVTLGVGAGDVTYVVPNTRVIMVNPASGQSFNSSTFEGWRVNSASGATNMFSDDPNAVLLVPLPIPDGCTLEGIRVGCEKLSAGGTAMTVQLVRCVVNFTPGAINTPTITVHATISAVGTAGGEIVANNGYAFTVDKSTELWYARIKASSGAGAGTEDSVYWVEVQFDETRATGNF